MIVLNNKILVNLSYWNNSSRNHTGMGNIIINILRNQYPWKLASQIIINDKSFTIVATKISV